MLNTRKELVTAGVLEDREDYERQADGTLIKRTLIRPAGGQSYTESVGKLATVVKPKSNWGGSRWACPKNPDHKIMTKHVCTTCHVDAELVSVPEPPTPHFQVENRPAGSSGAAGTAEAQIRALIDRARHRRPSVSDFQVENGLRDPTAVEVHTQSHGAELGSPAPYFEVENRGCDASSLPPSSPRTYSVETQNSPPDARPADEDGPPNTNGKDTEQAAAKAWGRAALEAAAKLGYPTLMGADGRTRLVKDGQWQWEAVCRAAPPPTIELIAERIGAALERAEREDPF